MVQLAGYDRKTLLGLIEFNLFLFQQVPQSDSVSCAYMSHFTFVLGHNLKKKADLQRLPKSTQDKSLGLDSWLDFWPECLAKPSGIGATATSGNIFCCSGWTILQRKAYPPKTLHGLRSVHPSNVGLENRIFLAGGPGFLAAVAERTKHFFRDSVHFLLYRAAPRPFVQIFSPVRNLRPLLGKHFPDRRTELKATSANRAPKFHIFLIKISIYSKWFVPSNYLVGFLLEPVCLQNWNRCEVNRFAFHQPNRLESRSQPRFAPVLMPF